MNHAYPTEDAAHRAARAVRTERVHELTRRLVDVPSPTGEEGPVAHLIAEMLRDAGVEPYLQEIEPGRYNVIGRLRGSGGGPTVMLNGHMDTSYGPDEKDLPDVPGYRCAAFVPEGGGAVHGMGAHNMKGALACYIEACHALRESGTRLAGDLLLTFVSGEIQRHQDREHQGARYRGGGVGTRFMVGNGVLADYAIIGEPTGLKVVPQHVGTLGGEVRVTGSLAPLRWSSSGQDATVRGERVLRALRERMASRWQDEGRDRPGGLYVRGVVGGESWRYNRVSRLCRILLEFRLDPGTRLQAERRRLEAELAEIGASEDVDLTVEWYTSAPPAEGRGNEPVVRSVEAAHREATGDQADQVVGAFCSDGSVLEAYGIPVVNYGPGGLDPDGSPGWRPEHGELVLDSALTTASRVYTGAVTRLCGEAGGEAPGVPEPRS